MPAGNSKTAKPQRSSYFFDSRIGSDNCVGNNDKVKHEQTGSDLDAATGEAEGQGLHAWQWIALFAILATLLALAIFAYSAANISLLDSHDVLTEHIRELGMGGQMAIIGLMIAHCFVPFPAEFVAFAAGTIYGVYLGTLLTWTGAMIGAILSFWLTRIFGRPFVHAVLPKRQQQKLDRWTEDQGATTLLLSRFIPIISFNLINYAAGLTRIGFWTFVWTTGLGILPLTTLMVYMGARMRDVSWPWLLVFSAIGIAVMALLHVFIRRRHSG